MPLVVATRAKLDPNLRSLSRIKYRGFSPYGVASRSGTRNPGIAGRSGHIHVDDLSRFQVDDEESKKRTEEKVRDLEKIAGPNLCSMIVQESGPALSTRSFEANWLHIHLNGPFTHPNIQLEEFPTDAFSPPEPVVCRHLLDEGDRFERGPRLTRIRPRFALPEQTEELTRPSKDSLRLDNEEGLFPCSDHPGQKCQIEPIPLPVCRSFDLSTENTQLLS